MAAMKSVECKAVTTALEKVVEANILLSGLGFENNGVASAHGISHGFTVLKDAKAYLHGEKVAFCTIVQLVLEGRSPKLIDKIVAFCYQVGLPVTLADLGITRDVSANVELLANAVNYKIASNHSFEVTPRKIYQAIMLADSLGIAFGE